MTKPYRIINFSSDRFDQWRLSQVKGVITVKDRKPAFQFDTKEQFERYVQLNSFRGRVGV